MLMVVGICWLQCHHLSISYVTLCSVIVTSLAFQYTLADYKVVSVSWIFWLYETKHCLIQLILSLTYLFLMDL